MDGFVRLDIGESRPGWVAEGDLVGGAGSGQIALLYNHMPPQLELDFGNALVTRNESIQLRGEARDDQQIRDLYIYAGSRKVFYQSNAHANERRRAVFDTEVPLNGGVNYITVFARESGDVLSRQTIVVRRDSADGSLMETPRFDEGSFENHQELGGAR